MLENWKSSSWIQIRIRTNPNYNRLVIGRISIMYRIWFKSVSNFLTYHTNQQTDRQTNRQTRVSQYLPNLVGGDNKKMVYSESAHSRQLIMSTSLL